MQFQNMIMDHKILCCCHSIMKCNRSPFSRCFSSWDDTTSCLGCWTTSWLWDGMTRDSGCITWLVKICIIIIIDIIIPIIFGTYSHHLTLNKCVNEVKKNNIDMWWQITALLPDYNTVLCCSTETIYLLNYSSFHTINERGINKLINYGQVGL